MRPADVTAALAAVVPTGRPVYLWGPPGCGKSSVVRHAAALGLTLLDVRATLLDPVGLRGLPKVAKDRAEWCPPAFLPRTGGGLLFLDELAQAPPLVQAARLQLVLDRRLGEYELPAGWAVVAASNRAGTHRLISPLLNRFVHLDLDVSADDWQAWAVAANVALEVRAFLRLRPAPPVPVRPGGQPSGIPDAPVVAVRRRRAAADAGQLAPPGGRRARPTPACSTGSTGSRPRRPASSA